VSSTRYSYHEAETGEGSNGSFLLDRLAAHAVVGPCALGEELFQDRMPDSEVPSVPNIGNLVEQHPDIIAVSEPIEVEALAN